MRFTFLFIIGLIMVSGFIAYFGDLLGRRMGKKRLALFRLRPRYTAIVVTTITGMLISALALAALVSVNSQFKKVFTQGEQILEQNDRLTKSNTDLEIHNRTLARHSRELEREVGKRKKEVIAARKEASYATRARDIALKAVANLERDIQSRQKELDQLKKKGAITEKELQNKVAELREVQERMKTAQQDLSKAQARIAEAQTALTTAESRLVETEYRLEDTKRKLAQAEELLKQREQLIAEQQSWLNNAMFFNTLYGEGELIYRQGDEIVRGTVSPAQLNNGIEAALRELLDTASKKAAAQNAAKGSNGRCVSLVFMDPKTNRIVFNERDSLEGAVELISTSFNEVLVQVVCAFNATEGMQVPIELRLYKNNLVYKKGQKIAGTAVNGSDKEVNILFSLTDFLQQDVSRIALDAGIVPISNPTPQTAAGPNPREQFEMLMSVVDRIKAEDTPVYVDVIAAEDIYCKGPLNMTNMDFVIKKSY